MPSLLLRLNIDLEDLDARGRAVRSPGPLFHRWLPEGEKDAIEIPTGDSDASLRLWFERLGVTDENGWTRYDWKRREVNGTAIERQGWLEGGPLIGQLRIDGVSEELLHAMAVRDYGTTPGEPPVDDGYVALGKRIAKLLQPLLQRFVDTLRSLFGQYWLREVPTWDSRRQSLGGYCSHPLGLQWRDETTEAWRHFRPTAVGFYEVIQLGERPYLSYLTRDDWKRIAALMAESSDPNLAAKLATRAHQLAEEGHWRLAFIEATAALESALASLADRQRAASVTLHKAARAFGELPLRAQVAILVACDQNIPVELAEKALEGIDIRNKVVHEGADPPGDRKDALYALLSVVPIVNGGTPFKLPSMPAGNSLQLKEQSNE